MHRSTLEAEEFNGLVRQLVDRPTETEWIEFKENFVDPAGIGERLSGLSNSAALHHRPRGYLVWGIRDDDHAIVGTTINLDVTKGKGNEDLIPWLCRLLDPEPEMTLHEGEVEGQRILVLEVQAASHSPVQFSGEEYIRVGSYTKKLRANRTLNRQLWRALEDRPFEFHEASAPLTPDQILDKLDYKAYYELQEWQIPGVNDVIEQLAADSLIADEGTGRFSVTNVGALLFANDLREFPYVQRKAARVIKYKGLGKVVAEHEVEGRRGYACGFLGLVRFVNGLLPRTERIDEGLRESVHAYPVTAVRELIANALAHQDLSMAGAGPLIEIYDNRLEVTNPGEPLVSPEMFINAAPRSRNEKLATMLRRCGICEERGSGWDRIGFEIEYNQLPAPVIRVSASHTSVVVHGPKAVLDMAPDERVRAVYLHACLRYTMGEPISNRTLRERFRLPESKTSTVSVYIKDALDAGMILPYDPGASRQKMKYVPFWAKDVEESF